MSSVKQTSCFQTSKRSNSRFFAVQALYQVEIGNSDVQKVIEEFENFRFLEGEGGFRWRSADISWFRKVVSGVVSEQSQVDTLIQRALTADWSLNRIDPTVRSIMRAATYELLMLEKVPARVVIAEYMLIAEAFRVENEPRLINGVLAHLARILRPESFKDIATSTEINSIPSPDNTQ